jgi:hypothetical protein
MFHRNRSVFLYLIVISSLALAFFADGLRASLYQEPEPPTSPLFELQLNEKLQDMELLAPGASNPALQAPLIPPAQPSEQALIIFSEGVSGCAASACAASGCVGSACGGSGCGGSGCAGSGCAGSACGGSACGGSACAGSACGVSGCAGSGCAGSGCVGSGCVGSVCAGSGCAGSACVGTGCAGSACEGCSKATDGETEDETRAANLCPWVAPGNSAGRITSLEPEATRDGMALRWIFTGAEAESYRVWSDWKSEQPVLVSRGSARADELTEIFVPAGGTTLVVEIIDARGLPVRVELATTRTL